MDLVIVSPVFLLTLGFGYEYLQFKNQMLSVSETVNLQKQELDELKIELEEVKEESVANMLLKKKLYLPLTLLPPLKGNKFYYHEVIGFSIIENAEILGIIFTIHDKGSQALFEIKRKQGTALIPIHDDFIVDVNRINKTITVTLPEGLIDL